MNGVNGINCWDSSLTPIANRTDGATAITNGVVTCAPQAVTCVVSLVQSNNNIFCLFLFWNSHFSLKTNTATGAGTCSTTTTVTPTITNGVMYLYCTGLSNGPGCNQITTCWNPAMVTSVLCTNVGSSTSTNTFACYVSESTLDIIDYIYLFANSIFENKLKIK